mgnify:CR=1 FL=1
MNKIINSIIILSLQCIATSYVHAATVYSTGFESGLDSEWSAASPISSHVTLGNYNGSYTTTGSTTLTLTGLGAHDHILLNFDLYLFNTWDGNATSVGPDYFSLEGDVTFKETFTNHRPEGQSYLGLPTETLGSGTTATYIFRNLGPAGDGDGFMVAHTGSTFSVTFLGPTDQTDEQWGIDNVQVSTMSTVPVPSAFWLLGSGFLGLIRLTRKN